jgi:uncharacterized membrane protein
LRKNHQRGRARRRKPRRTPARAKAAKAAPSLSIPELVEDEGLLQATLPLPEPPAPAPAVDPVPAAEPTLAADPPAEEETFVPSLGRRRTAAEANSKIPYVRTLIYVGIAILVAAVVFFVITTLETQDLAPKIIPEP